MAKVRAINIASTLEEREGKEVKTVYVWEPARTANRKVSHMHIIYNRNVDHLDLTEQFRFKTQIKTLYKP